MWFWIGEDERVIVCNLCIGIIVVVYFVGYSWIYIFSSSYWFRNFYNVICRI